MWNPEEGQKDCNYLRHCLVTPIVLRFIPEIEKGVGSIDQRVIQSIASSFKHGNSDIGVLTQTSRNDQTCSPASHDDIVVRFGGEIFSRHDQMKFDT
jgi:hypothetical protein